MKTYKKLISYAATAGATLSLAVLSMGGVLLMTSSMGLGIAAFFLAAAIEGAVYRGNIFAAMQKLGNHEETIKRGIAKRELEKIITAKTHENNKFLQDYLNQKKYLHELSEIEDKLNSEQKKIAKQEKVRVEQRLALMELTFIQAIEYPISPTIPTDVIELAKLSQTINSNALTNEVDRKKTYMMLSTVVAVGSGVCAGFVVFSSAATCLSAIGLAASAATILGGPIAGFAALGYAFLMYHTLTDIIKNDKIQKWIEQIKEFWNTPADKRDKWYYLKGAGIVFLIGLTILTTLATAGTWWYLAQAGAQMIAPLKGLAGSITSLATWSMTLIPNIFFGIRNALLSAKKFPGFVKSQWQVFFGHKHHHEHRESSDTKTKIRKAIQFLNVFNLVRNIFNAAVFLGHLVSVAATSDGVPWLKPAITVPANTLMEAATDLHYVVPHEHAHHHTECNGHHHHNNHEDHHHDHAHDDDDHHHHGDFVTGKINLLLNWTSVCWVAFFGYVFGEAASWQKAKAKFFPQADLPKPTQLSLGWMKYETTREFGQHATAYQGKQTPAATTKAGAFLNIKQKLASADDANFKETLNNSLETERNPHAVLTTHRDFLGFLKGSPRSLEIIEEVRADRSYGLR